MDLKNHSTLLYCVLEIKIHSKDKKRHKVVCKIDRLIAGMSYIEMYVYSYCVCASKGCTNAKRTDGDANFCTLCTRREKAVVGPSERILSVSK